MKKLFTLLMVLLITASAAASALAEEIQIYPSYVKTAQEI